MAHGLNAMLKRGPSGGGGGGTLGCKADGKTGIGSRRIFAPQFKLQVLDSYRNDTDCKGNQRATARKYGIHRRQIQKWLQVEGNLRNSVLKGSVSGNNNISGNNNNNNMMKMNSSSSNSNSVVVTTTTSNTSASVSELIVCPEALSSRKCGLAVALRSGAHSGRQQDDSSGSGSSSSGSVVPQQPSGAVCMTETDIHHQQQQQQLHHEQLRSQGEEGRVAGGVLVVQQQQQQQALSGSGEREDRGSSNVLVDKRVPDIQHNNNNTAVYQPQHQLAYEWQHYQMRRSPDTASSTSGSCYSDLGDISPLLHHQHQPHNQQPLPLVACSDGQCDECMSELALPLDYTMHTRTQQQQQQQQQQRASTVVVSVHGGASTQQRVPPAAHSPLLTSIPSPVPLTAHHSSPPPAARLASVPMDLSVRRRRRPPPHQQQHSPPPATIHATGTPVPVIAAAAAALVPPAPSTTTTSPPPPPSITPHIWDLSTVGRSSGGGGGVKRPYDQEINTTTTSAAAAAGVGVAARGLQHAHPRPVKLFKPYLDHVSDEETAEVEEECDVKPVISTAGAAGQQPMMMISPGSYDTEYLYNNNNNGDYKMDYTVLYKEEYSNGGGGGGGGGGGTTPYYCPLSDYYPNGGVQYISTSTGQELIVHHAGPFMVGSNGTNNNSSSSAAAAAAAASVHSIKQRQSYSLDFKLSAIECYYRDAVCRGNQRAVASKFRIHRRQVQKWLKQEDQLRQRNETIRPIHIVR